MKVIFLDHDGVICLSNNWGSRFKKQKKWGGRKLSMTSREIPLEFRFDNFDKKAVKILNEILEESQAEIVVSSDWKRHANLDDMKDYYSSQGISKGPIDFTDVFHFTDWKNQGIVPDHGEFPWSRTHDLEQERHFEIKKWISEHDEITKWVAIDDLHMGVHVEDSAFGNYEREWGLANFVWTPKSSEGIKQTGIKEKILKYLS